MQRIAIRKPKSSHYYIGLMSGTSMDGVDAALVDTQQHQLVKGITLPYASEVMKRLESVIAEDNTSIEALCELNYLVGLAFATAVNRLLEAVSIRASDIIAIGSHGQTLRHCPDHIFPYTYQVGCAHTIAVKTGISVVADFRTRDLCYGGQGAPLAPLYHQVLFQTQQTSVAIVNIGGVANITFLHPDKPAIGYDTGPGNCLLDAWAQRYLDTRYDHEGQWASTGQADEHLLSQFLEDPFFRRSFPKSVDKSYFSLDWLAQFLTPELSPEAVQATLTLLVVASVKRAIETHLPSGTSVFLCGGGIHNKHLIACLKKNLSKYTVVSAAERGIDPDFLEAMMMAWLAERAIQQERLDLQAITGSTQPMILGAVYKV